MALSKIGSPRNEPAVLAPPSYSDATTTPLTPATEISPSSSVEGSPRASILSLETTAYSGQPEMTGTAPPAGAQRARAPFRVEKTDQGIRDNFLVTAGTSKDHFSPDAVLHTTNSPIDCGVWVDDSPWKRPFEIFVKTTNAKINLAMVGTKGVCELVQCLHLDSTPLRLIS